MDPYIGVTGFSNSGQVSKMVKIFEANRQKSSRRVFHVGVMMFYRTLNGMPCDYRKMCPSNEMSSVVLSDPRTFNCLHYADYVGRPKLAKSLAKAIRFGGSGLDAIQLDMTWPDPVEIMEGVVYSGREVEVILQIGRNAFEQINDDPVELVGRLREYRGVIHRVLLDKSMGQGLGMDAEALLPFAWAVKEHFPELGIVVAGGLGPKTVHLAEPLVRELPDISLDAQGQLCPGGNMLNPIDLDMTRDYIVESLKLVD